MADPRDDAGRYGRSLRPGELLDRHARRIGVKPEMDAAVQLQLALLRDFLEVLHSALDDEHVHPDVTHRVIERVIYGGVPTRAEVELRVRLTEDMTATLARGLVPPIITMSSGGSVDTSGTPGVSVSWPSS